MSSDPANDVAVDLRKKYILTLRRREQDASRWKWWSQLVMATSIGTSVCLSIVGIVGMMMQFKGRTVSLPLAAAPIALGIAGLASTVADVIVNPRMRWMTYREAVHRLWRTAMFYRAGLDPTGRLPKPEEDLRQLFEAELTDLEGHVGDKKGDWLEIKNLHDLRGALGLAGTWQSQLQRVWQLPDAPVTGRAPSHLAEEDPFSDPPDAEDYLTRRVDNQICWFLRKARINRNWYLGLSGIIASVYAMMGLYFIVWGRAYWLSVACSAFIMGTNMLIGFLNCRPLWQQYRTTGEQLRATKEQFTKRAHPYTEADSVQNLRQLVRNVESILETEFYFWHAIHQQAQPASFSLCPSRDPDKAHR